MKFRTFLTVVMLLASFLYGFAGNYKVKKGGTLTVPCTATAPSGGWITHTFYQFVNPEDSKYLGISSNSSDCKATYYGLNVRSNIKIEVTYAYSYRGTYDENIHVGHASYYDYITVEGAPNATGVSVREGKEISMVPGQTVTLHADFKPSNADGVAEWGLLNDWGHPYCFKLKVNSTGSEAYVTGKEEGEAYLICMLPGDQSTVNVVTLKCSQSASSKLPTAISLSPNELKLTEGKSLTISPSFTPSDSYSPIKWESSDEAIATVSESGVVKGIDSGTATITATTENGLKSEAVVTVVPIIESFTVPSSVTVNLGYDFKVKPTVYPEGAEATFSYKSDNSSIVSTSNGGGSIRGCRVGTATVTVSNSVTKTSKEIIVNVVDPGHNKSRRQVANRLRLIKATANRAIMNQKK